MKALEMEDAEVESFLDNDDQALDQKNQQTINRNKGRAAKNKAKPLQLITNSIPTPSSTPRIVNIAVVFVVLVFFAMLAMSAFSGKNAAVEVHQPVHSHVDNNNNVASSSLEEDEEVEEEKEVDLIAEETPAEQAEPAATEPMDPEKLEKLLQHSPPLQYSKMATVIPDPFHSDITDAQKAQWAEKFGKWGFWDGDESLRPSTSYCGSYPNCDIPGSEFPESAWQADAVFVNHFLDAAERLIARAKEAIFTEYGHGKPLPPEDLLKRYSMFQWDKFDSLQDQLKPPEKFAKNGARDIGGWTTKRSFDGLVRRLLHAIMTTDEFTVVLAGHSAAAGHGNHFHQSYIMQFHQIMAPILARLGVKLVTRNMSQGGLGTLHNSLGFQNLYGTDIDLLLWDTGMTEPENSNTDVFYRQALISSNRKVPVIWGGPFHLLRALHEHADVDVGEFGNAMSGIPETVSEAEAKKVPFAARYLKCPTEMSTLCEKHKFCAHCWLPRQKDVVDPKKLFAKIDTKYGGQVSWHYGWRYHRLISRVLAFALLDALQSAIHIWSEGTMSGPPLDEDFWHVTAYYENIRNKAKNLPEDIGACYKGKETGVPSRVCNTPMKGRGEHTPRINPAQSSLTSILRPAPDGYIPQVKHKVLYDGPDGHNDCDDIPEDETDVLAIVSGRRLSLKHFVVNQPRASTNITESAIEDSFQRRLEPTTGIEPGKGWEVIEELPGQCDGAYTSICGRQADNTCPASGHHDSRGMISGNEYSGWLVMELPDVKEGLIILKVVTWLIEENSPRTVGWTSVNNEGGSQGQNNNNNNNKNSVDNGTSTSEGEVRRRRRRLEQPLDSLHNKKVDVDSYSDSHRLIEDFAKLPDTFEFEYAINGEITTLNKDQFIERHTHPQRVVELITLLDDSSFTDKVVPVELAIRLRGCQRICTFGFSHVYWA